MCYRGYGSKQENQEEIQGGTCLLQRKRIKPMAEYL